MSIAQTPFGIVPVEVAMDQRLTLQQMRVLIALYTFRNRNTEMAHPTREEIRERTGMALSKISTATSDLERLGWLTKVGNGGRSQATRYRVHVPETVTEQETVTKQETVTDSVKNGSRFGNETLTESGRGIEQTIHTKEQTNSVSASAPTTLPANPSPAAKIKTDPKPAKPAGIAQPDGVCPQVWADFLQVRKAKRSPLTATALAGIEREAAKAGIGLQQALEVCCESGWAGFKADWFANQRTVNAPAQGRGQIGRKKAQSFAEKDYGTGIQVL